MDKQKALKVLKHTSAVLWWVLVILVAFITVSVVGAKIKGKVPSIFGYSVLHIVTGSMEPEIPENTYILVKKTAPEDVRRGQIITFYSDDPEIYGFPNTHRVVEDPIVTEDGIEFVTGGDANSANDDETAKSDKLVGVYVGQLGFLTKFSEFLGGNTVFFILMALTVGIFAMNFYTIFRIGGDSKKTEEEIAEQAVKDYIREMAVKEYLAGQELADNTSDAEKTSEDSLGAAESIPQDTDLDGEDNEK